MTAANMACMNNGSVRIRQARVCSALTGPPCGSNISRGRHNRVLDRAPPHRLRASRKKLGYGGDVKSAYLPCGVATPRHDRGH